MTNLFLKSLSIDISGEIENENLEKVACSPFYAMDQQICQQLRKNLCT